MTRARWALLLGLAACRVGGTSAIAPELSERDGATQGDTSPVDTIVDVPKSPDAGPLGPQPDAARATPDASVPMSTSCASAVDCIAPSGCASAEYGGHVYFVCADATTWDDARERCRAARADLAIIEDMAENDFVASQLGAPSWIGLNDLDAEGDYRWVQPGEMSVSGSSASFTNWATAVPDNCGAGLFGQQDCVRIASNGTWNDSDCAGGCTEGTFAFVCESL